MVGVTLFTFENSETSEYERKWYSDRWTAAVLGCDFGGNHVYYLVGRSSVTPPYGIVIYAPDRDVTKDPWLPADDSNHQVKLIKMMLLIED